MAHDDKLEWLNYKIKALPYLGQNLTPVYRVVVFFFFPRQFFPFRPKAKKV